MSTYLAPTDPTPRSTGEIFGSGVGEVAVSAEVGGYVARRRTALAAIEPLWRSLQTEGAATAYQRLDWAGRVIRHLAASSQAEPIFIEVVEAGSHRTVMLAPLALVRHRGYRVVTWLDLGVCDYAAPLLAPGIDLTPGQMAGAWRAVRAVLPPADLIRVSRIPARIAGRPNPIAALPRCRRMAMQASGVSIAGEASTVLERICRPSVRKDLAKLRRRLDRQGAVAFVQAANPAEVDAIFDALVAQRRGRFAEMGRFDLLSRPEVEAFYRDGAHHGLVGGPARLFGLSVDGVWIAAAYGLVHGATFHGLLLTMAGGKWRNASPGLHIVAEAMRWAALRDVAYFDFTVGVMPYKEDFGVQAQDLDEIVEILSLRGAIVKAALEAGSASMTWLRTKPDWYARLQKARRWVRRRATGNPGSSSAAPAGPDVPTGQPA